MNKTYEIVKRILDILIATIGIICCIPIFVVLSIIVKINSKGPIFYKQERIGKHGKKFKIYKFRTMKIDADKIENMPKKLQEEYKKCYKIKNDQRITKLGYVLRKWNLDELPQLFNIIKGDMSFVGPRPVLQEEVEKYGKNKEKFLSVIPGLTGFWQVNNEKCRNYDERIEMELYYIKNRNLLLDVKIFFKTLKNMLVSNLKR